MERSRGPGERVVSAPGRPGWFRRRTRGCSRPRGCCSGRGLEEGGTGKREDGAARHGTRQRDPREPARRPSPAAPDGARYTKGLASQRRWRPRGTAGSAQQGGAVVHPAPQPRPRDRPGPTPRPPPLRGVPLPPLSAPPPCRGLSLPRVCAPIPAPRRREGSTQRRSWGPGNPQRTRALGVLSGLLSQGPELTPFSSPPLLVICAPPRGCGG